MKRSHWIFNYGNRPQCANCKIFSRSEETTPYCAYCSAQMENYSPFECSAYHEEYGRKVCYGTKEREECICGGDRRKCDFYEDVRRRANGEAF